MTNLQLISLIVVIAFGFISGIKTAQISHKREPIHSKGLAKLCHYLAASVLTAIIPSVLVSAFIFHLGIRAVLVAIILIVAALLLLIIYATFEKSALAQIKIEDPGWTEEDARASGL